MAGAGQVVTFKVHGVTYHANTNSKGYASLKINLAHKSYTMSVSFKGDNEKNKVVVKNIIKVKKTRNVKKSGTTKIKVLLKGKKLYKNKKVIVKFRGKSYNLKTNKKGYAYFKVTSKMVKNLKVGKTYSYNVKYNKDYVKRYVKIKG